MVTEASGKCAPIHGVATFQRSVGVTRSWRLRVPSECTTVIVDTPAALDAQSFPEITRGADAIVPVVPSDIDIHATAKCIADLLLVAKIRRSENRIGIVVNRVRANALVTRDATLASATGSRSVGPAHDVARREAAPARRREG